MSESQKTKRNGSANKQSARRIVLRWHRRVGISSAIAVILLSLTGIALNHISSVFDANESVSSEWLLDWYDVPVPQSVFSYRTPEPGDSEFIWADGNILVNGQTLLFAQARLLGALNHQDLLYLITANAIHVFADNGQFVESIPITSGAEFANAKLVGEAQIKLQGSTGSLMFDLNTLLKVDADGLSEGVDLGSRLQTHQTSDDQTQLARAQLLTKSSVLLDLHSGRFFGRFGPWLMDFFAVCFFLLAISGIFVWMRQSSRKKR